MDSCKDFLETSRGAQNSNSHANDKANPEDFLATSRGAHNSSSHTNDWGNPEICAPLGHVPI
jgi:hypothetical protein